MEIKVDSGTVSLACADDVQELFQAAAELIKHATSKTGNVTSDVNVPIIYGTDADFRQDHAGRLQISVLTQVGWAVLQVPDDRKMILVQTFADAVGIPPTNPGNVH